MSATAPDGDPAAADVRPAADDDGSPYLWVFRRFLLAAIAPAVVLACNELLSPSWSPVAVDDTKYLNPGISFTTLAPAAAWTVRSLRWLAIALAIGLALLVPTRKRRGWMPGLTACWVGLAATLLCWWSGVPSWWLSWQDEDDAAALDQQQYALLRKRWMGGSGDALCRVTPSDIWRTEYSFLVRGDWDDEYYGAAMIRPASRSGHALAIGRNGLAASVRGGICLWVYDTKAGTGAIGADVVDQSPFALLDDVAPGCDEDVDSIASRVAEERRSAATTSSPPLLGHDLGIPGEKPLLDALGHTNPWVRAAARRIIEAGGAEMYPEATKRIADAPK